MTNGDILANARKLAILLNNCNIIFPANISYKIIRNYHVLNDLEVTINQARDQLISQMYEPVIEEPGTYKPKNGLAQKAKENMEALYNVENEVNLQTITFSEIAHMELPLEVMDAIYFMIKED